MSEPFVELEAAWQELDRLTKGGRFVKCIPVQPTDSDIVIGNALRWAQEVAAERDALRAQVDKLTNERIDEIEAAFLRHHLPPPITITENGRTSIEGPLARLLRMKAEAEKYRLINALVSERHGDDGLYEMPEDGYGDDPETITIKRLFSIIESKGETK